MKKNEADLWEFYQTKVRESFINSHPRFDYLTKLIKKHKSSGRYLDIGLGDGYFIAKMASCNFECFGIDIAEKSLDVNYENLIINDLKATLREGNINKIPFADDSFDVISASEVLEHLEESDLLKGIAEVARCLAAEGIFVGTVPADEILSDNYCFCPDCGNFFHRWGHKQSFSKHRLEGLFAKDFKNVKIFKIPNFQNNVLLAERIKYYVRKIRCKLTPNLIVGTYVIIAHK